MRTDYVKGIITGILFSSVIAAVAFGYMFANYDFRDKLPGHREGSGLGLGSNMQQETVLKNSTS